MIESRELFLEDDKRPPFYAIEDVEAYGEKAFASILYLLLEALAKDSKEVKGHARHAAKQVLFKDSFLP